LRNLVAVEALRTLFNDKDDNPDFSRKNIWVHSATVAILSQMIARRIFAIDGENVFLAGIIHDIGLIVEDQLAGEELRKACGAFAGGKPEITVVEDEYIGTNHAKVGRLLAADWKLPDEVIEAIRFHHRKDKEYPLPGVISILQIAEFIACKMKYGVVTGRSEALPRYLASHMKSRVADYKVLLKAFPDEMAKAKELYESSGDDK
jgi:putative nucleotidyltransferase with HDIG domain